MDDRRNDVDTWLQARIDPLPPPPGTFELIKRRARRRKLRKVAVTASAAAAVIAAIVVVPQMTSVLHVTQNQGSAAANGSAAGPAQRGTMTVSGRPNHATPAPAGAGGTGKPPVPADFAAGSVTFVGLHTGWVMGQAGAPGQACATRYCTSMARTDNAGKTWYGVHAPVTGSPDGGSGVSQVRFLNTHDGWAFGPGLYATVDGGQSWTQVPTGGQRVVGLETVGDRAFAVFATCGGTGSDFAAQCTSFTLKEATAGSNVWSPVPGPVTGLGDHGQASSATLVLTASRGYLLAPGGALYAGPVTGSGAWQQVSTNTPDGAPCGPGTAQADGQPSMGKLAAAGPSSLVLACEGQAAGSSVYTSADGGQTWRQQGYVPGGDGPVTSVAAQPGGEIVAATTSGIAVSHDGGSGWQQATVGGAPPGGFSYVGMTSPQQGVAVPAHPTAEHAIWFTFDGGLTWQVSPVKG